MIPVISIIVPVYNTPTKYLRESILSAKNQSLRDKVELVVFDDGSTPQTKEELKKIILETGKSTKILYGETSENRGLAFARNAAVEMASGDYVLFLDSDDILDETICEKSIQYFDKNISLIYTNHMMVTSNRDKIVHERDKRVYQNLLVEFKNTLYDPLLFATFIFHCQIIRRNDFVKVGGLRTDLGYGDEVDMHLRLGELTNSVNFALLPEHLYFYRENASSIVHNQELYVRLIKNIEQVLVEAGQRRGFDITSAKRFGRATPTHAAHYELFDSNGVRIVPPYFDYDACKIRGEYLNRY